ncbi:hypothetical protein J2T21_000917 [Paeniglutamicibacter psychrophenolicus]|nr:hypothetical protein [Paeniglutamicibacter psychrophenolicus]MDQ0093050.1 hypothetical protein [Paeniglutamicibacter psychrophenolicus]
MVANSYGIGYAVRLFANCHQEPIKLSIQIDLGGENPAFGPGLHSDPAAVQQELDGFVDRCSGCAKVSLKLGFSGDVISGPQISSANQPLDFFGDFGGA